MKFTYNTYPTEAFNKLIHDTADDLILREFKDIFEGYKCPIRVRHVSTIRHVYENYFMHHRGHMTKKYIAKELCFADKIINESILAASYTGYIDDNDIMHVDGLTIDIYVDCLGHYILKSLHNLDALSDAIKILVRHEVGHLIDYLLTYDGCTGEFYRETCERRRQQLIDYNSFRSTETANKLDAREYNRKYYTELESESCANTCANVDLEALLDVADRLDYPRDRDITLEITKTSDVERKKSEEE